MKKTLSVIFALTLVITFSAAVFAYLEEEDMADDRLYYACGENNEYIFVSVEAGARSDEIFPETGLYTNDESHIPIYTMDKERLYENTYVSRDGGTVAFVLYEFETLDINTKCCEVYKNGKMINSLDMLQVCNVFSFERFITDFTYDQTNSAYGYRSYDKEWCSSQTQTPNDIVTLQLLNGRTVFIDLNNGTIFYTPNYFQTAVILLNAIALTAVLIILKIKRCRKASRI